MRAKLITFEILDIIQQTGFGFMKDGVGGGEGGGGGGVGRENLAIKQTLNGFYGYLATYDQGQAQRAERHVMRKWSAERGVLPP